MSEAKRDQNRVATLLGVSSSDGITPVPLYADPTTHRLYVDLPTGSGDVTGPASSVDNAIARFHETSGKIIQGYTSDDPTIGDTGIGSFGAGLNSAYYQGKSATLGALIYPTNFTQTTSTVFYGNDGASAFVRRNTMLSDGKFGIGVDAPSEALDVLGNAVLSGYTKLVSPAANSTATGHVTGSFQSGYTAAAFDLVYMGTGGKWLEVDADAVATCNGLLGIALEAKNNTEAMLVALPGSFVRFDTWNWTVGATLYAGETLGAMQETIPTGADAIIRVVGFAVSADVIYFNPSSDQQSTVA
jgi:hypothetical protein